MEGSARKEQRNSVEIIDEASAKDIRPETIKFLNDLLVNAFVWCAEA